MGVLEKVLHGVGGWALEHISQGNGHGTESAGVQELLGQCSHTYGLIFR